MRKYQAVLSAFFAGVVTVLAKAGVKNISGNAATAIRTTVVLLIAWSLLLFSGGLKEIKRISKSNPVLLLVSGIATGLSYIFYFKATETSDVSKVAAPIN